MDKTVPLGRVKGTLTPPCSKSYAQRALAASLLCGETSVLRNLEFCDDTRSALRCIETLGARVKHVDASTLSIEGGLHPRGKVLHVGESGLATRLFTPIASLWLTSLTVQGCLLLVWLLGKGYTNLLLISTSMILVPYLLIGLFLLKLVFSGKGGQGRGLMRVVAMVSSGYGFWLLYAAGVEYLLLSLLLYGPGLLLFLYSRRQLGAEQRLSGRERLLAGVTLLSLIPAVWSFVHV